MIADYVRQDTPDGGAAFLIGTDSEAFTDRLQRASNGTSAETPTPESGEGDDKQLGGPVERFTDNFSPLGMGLLEHLGLTGHEIADAVQMRVTELYRNEFPVIEPRFEQKCTADDCGAELEERVDECPICGADTRDPDAAERQRFEGLLKRVNKEGQSFRELAKALEFDQGFLGVPVLVIRYEYNRLGEPKQVTELVKGDPKRIVPVVDEQRRIGGHWWACFYCRGEDGYDPAEEPGHCASCGAELREVYFAEYGDTRNENDIEAYYFADEVLTFPWYFPRLNGLDGLSPVHHVWLKQLIIEYQDSYAGDFYDPDSDRLPNQFIVLHTTNPDAWEERLAQARQNSKEDKYDSPIYTNEYHSTDQTVPKVQVIDAMPDELLGQNDVLKDTFKKDIRQAFNIADVFDSDLDEAGGLNNEGLQLEVTDRSIATQMHDYATGWLDELAKRLGVEDWTLGFIPSAGPDAEDLINEVRAGKDAEDAGLDARMVSGQTEVADGPFEPGDEGLDRVQKAGNWLKVNEGREALGLSPVGDTDEEDFGAPGRVGAMQADVGGGEGPPAEDEAVPFADEGGDGSSHDFGPELQRASTDDLADATDALFRAHQHLIWPELTEQRADEPFWDRDEDMPEFVEAMIREALRGGAIREISDSLPAGTTRSQVRNFFQSQLEQPSGWSLRSLTENYAQRFGVPESEAVTAVRTQTTSILNEAREEGYRAQGDVDDRRFKHVGPDDADNTDTCEAIRQRTNPKYGGDPVSLDEYKDVLAEERAKEFPTFRGPDTIAHFNCRHTYVEHFD